MQFKHLLPDSRKYFTIKFKFRGIALIKDFILIQYNAPSKQVIYISVGRVNSSKLTQAEKKTIKNCHFFKRCLKLCAVLLIQGIFIYMLLRQRSHILILKLSFIKTISDLINNIEKSFHFIEMLRQKCKAVTQKSRFFLPRYQTWCISTQRLKGRCRCPVCLVQSCRLRLRFFSLLIYTVLIRQR